MWIIKITSFIPYPYDKEYREEATQVGTAINRAVKKFRKEERIKGRKIKKYNIKAIKV